MPLEDFTPSSTPSIYLYHYATFITLNMPNPRGHRNPAAGHLTIAPTVSIDSNCTIPDAPVADVTIGNCVNIGPNVTIISVHHSKTVSERSERLMYAENVTIGDYAWIGAGAAILYVRSRIVTS